MICHRCQKQVEWGDGALVTIHRLYDPKMRLGSPIELCQDCEKALCKQYMESGGCYRWDVEEAG